MLGTHARGAHHSDVANIAIVVVLVPDVEARRVGPVHPDVVVDRAIGALAELHADADAQIVVDLIVGGAIV